MTEKVVVHCWESIYVTDVLLNKSQDIWTDLERMVVERGVGVSCLLDYTHGQA